MERPDPSQHARKFVEYWQSKNEAIQSSTIRSQSLNLKGLVTVTENVLALLLSTRAEIHQSRRALTMVVLKEELETESFQVRWKKLSRKQREGIMIESLVFLCTKLDVEAFWEYCPEVTLAEMCSGDGEGFLTLLDHFSMGNQELNSNPTIYFPILKHDSVWRVNEISIDDEEAMPVMEGVRGVQNYILVARHRFLSLFILHTMGTFLHLPSSITYANSSKTDLNAEDKSALKVARKITPALKAPLGASQDRMGERCEFCQCSKSSTVKLFLCSKCKEIGRYVFYCSRECQTKSYKESNPPHKTVCGKLLRDLDPTATSSPASTISTPLDFPLFTTTPSPELRVQVFLLGQKETCDYNFIKTASRARAPCSFLSGEVKSLFLEMRRNAMEHCDLKSIGVMDLLLRTMGVPPIPGATTDDWSEQLMKEYSVEGKKIDIIECRNRVMEEDGLMAHLQLVCDAEFLEESSTA